MTTEISGAQIMAAVQAYRPWALRHVPLSDVDDVLSEAAHDVWKRRHTFNPELGELGHWIGGFVRTSAKRVQRSECRAGMAQEALQSSTESAELQVEDSLDQLIGRWNANEVLRWIALALSDSDWNIVLDMALRDMSSNELAERHGISVRQLEDVRRRLRSVAGTVQAALDAAASDEPLTMATAVACVPVKSERVRGLLQKLAQSPRPTAKELAKETGLAEKTVRNELPRLESLVSLAAEILMAHSVSSKGQS